MSVSPIANNETSSIQLGIDEVASRALTEHTHHDTSDMTFHWDGPDDPVNPKNWPISTRVANATIMASISLLSSFASSIFFPAIPYVMRQFGVTNKVIGPFTISPYALGMGFSPFFLSPLSELYGRWIVYASSLSLFTFLQLGCALSNSMQLLAVLQFFAGLSGGVGPGLGQASMSDLWKPEDRGRWAVVVALGSMLGLPLGSSVAALVLSVKRWHWIFWITMIFSGALLLLTLFVLQETYEPVVLRKRRRLCAQAVRVTSQVKQDFEKGSAPDPTGVFRRAITRPTRFLATSPILIIFSFFLAYMFGILYFLLSSLPFLFGEEQSHGGLFSYHFNRIGPGFSYLGLAIGMFLACPVQMYSQTRIWIVFMKRNRESQSEYRLLPMTVGMSFLPVALLLYGWSGARHAPWIVPQIAAGMFGFGMLITFQSVQAYLTEAFMPYSASAIAAATLMRSVTGAALPLFAQQMFIHLGYGKSGTLLSMLALLVVPLPWILYKNGSYLRKRWAIAP